MKEFIGVLDSKLLLIPQSQKRNVLLFDRLAVPRFLEFWSILKKHEPEFDSVPINDLRWLHDRGIIYEPNLEVSQEVFERRDFAESARAALESLMQFRALRRPDFDNPLDRKAAGAQMAYFFVDHGTKVSRYVSIMLREQNCDAVPLIVIPTGQPAMSEGQTEVASIVLNNLPIPSEQTSWEQILEFRNDPDTKEKFFRLRRWMRDVSKDQLSPVEIEEQLESLLHDYKRHMELHRLKIEPGTLETILTTSGDLIENLVKFKWGKLAQSMFTLRHRKLALLEAEMNAPGAEIAYIYQSTEQFS
jgi:hypothetical protein